MAYQAAQRGAGKLSVPYQHQPSTRAIVETVRYLLSGHLPEASSILLVESGSRGILEKVIAGLRRSWGADVPSTWSRVSPTCRSAWMPAPPAYSAFPTTAAGRGARNSIASCAREITR